MSINRGRLFDLLNRPPFSTMQCSVVHYPSNLNIDELSIYQPTLKRSSGINVEIENLHRDLVKQFNVKISIYWHRLITHILDYLTTWNYLEINGILKNHQKRVNLMYLFDQIYFLF